MSTPFEPELLCPPPLPVRRRPGRGRFLGCAHLFVLPHCLAGLYLLAPNGFLGLSR
jgi:hypothetical protein